MNAIDYEIGETNDGYRGASEAVIAGDVESLRPLPRISVHAFCVTESVYRVMEQCATDRRLARVSMRITHGNIAAAANMFSSTPTPNLIILETEAGPRELMAELAPLAEVCDPSSRVIVVGRHNDIALYRELIRSGISEYIVAPFSMADIMAAMSSIFVDPEPSRSGGALPSSAPRAAWGHRPSRTTVPSASPLCFRPKRCSPISTFPSGRPISISTRIRLRAWQRRCSHRNGLTRYSSTAC